MARDDLCTASEARKLLGISKNKMAELLKEGALEFVRNPLDRRRKLVRRTDLEELLKFK